MSRIVFKELIEQAQTAGLGGDFITLDAGEYYAQVQSCSFKESQNGKPMWRVVFVVTAGPQTGGKVGNNYTLSADNPTAVSIWLRHVSVLGVSGDFLKGEPTTEAIRNRIAETRALVTLKTGPPREHNGAMYTNVVNTDKPAADAKPFRPPANGAPPAGQFKPPVDDLAASANGGRLISAENGPTAPRPPF